MLGPFQMHPLVTEEPPLPPGLSLLDPWVLRYFPSVEAFIDGAERDSQDAIRSI